ncbi:hypothetical protein LCGC14_0534410 [marine sediment metagenome]|uniref:Uncharacterized protein n=1 Tax=marine sediment metagenome TaxID=412755 RepID=A0A0F9SD40_9ZZZZ
MTDPTPFLDWTIIGILVAIGAGVYILCDMFGKKDDDEDDE